MGIGGQVVKLHPEGTVGEKQATGEICEIREAALSIHRLRDVFVHVVLCIVSLGGGYNGLVLLHHELEAVGETFREITRGWGWAELWKLAGEGSRKLRQ